MVFFPCCSLTTAEYPEADTSPREAARAQMHTQNRSGVRTELQWECWFSQCVCCLLLFIFSFWPGFSYSVQQSNSTESGSVNSHLRLSAADIIPYTPMLLLLLLTIFIIYLFPSWVIFTVGATHVEWISSSQWIACVVIRVLISLWGLTTGLRSHQLLWTLLPLVSSWGAPAGMSVHTSRFQILWPLCGNSADHRDLWPLVFYSICNAVTW